MTTEPIEMGRWESAERLLLALIAMQWKSSITDELVDDLGNDLEWDDEVSIDDIVRPLQSLSFSCGNAHGVHSLLIDELLLINIKGIGDQNPLKCLFIGSFVFANAIRFSKCGMVPDVSMAAIASGAARLPYGLRLATIQLLLSHQSISCDQDEIWAKDPEGRMFAMLATTIVASSTCEEIMKSTKEIILNDRNNIIRSATQRARCVDSGKNVLGAACMNASVDQFWRKMLNSYSQSVNHCYLDIMKTFQGDNK